MGSYELMIILRPDIDPTDNKKRDSILEKLLGADAKYIKETVSMGKKRLAYEIDKNHEGVYNLVKLEAPHLEAGLMRKQAKLMPEIVRFLLLSV